MISHDQFLQGSYNFHLVTLSVLISIMASYAALDLAGRVTSARGYSRAVWLTGGAIAMGIGIWSMHYVGMLAFKLPIAVEYNWPTVLLSLLAAIFASATALFVVSRKSMSLVRAMGGSILMGSGIAGMHYIGMEAMRLPSMCHYSMTIVVVSVLLAIVIAFVALWLTFHFRGETKSGGWRKALSALAMGVAVPVMHYTGMAAAKFTPALDSHADLTRPLNISSLGTISIIIVTFMVLGLTILTSLIDRRFTAQALQLEASEKRSRQILETSFDAFIAMDSGDQIIEWNARSQEIFGWSSAQATGRKIPELLLPAAAQSIYESEIKQLLASGQEPIQARRFEVPALRRDGRAIPAEFTVSAMRIENSIYFAAFVRDLTQRKRFEQELHDAKSVAETANDAKSTFLATMSHEIRTPMNGILGMTELVLDTELTSDQREQLDLVRVSAESLLSIINDILDFSKIEAGKFEIESIPFELRESLGETMKSLGYRAHQKGIELIYEVQPELPESLTGDPGRIRQILINLVGNAIKFTERGEIVVTVTEEMKSTEDMAALHFAVRDTGVGVPREKQERIFEAFSQADGSMARKYGGTGLGLTICRRLSELMKGHIWMESQLGVGSTFHFVITLGVQDTPTAKLPAIQVEHLRNMHVLIVDDNFTNRRVLEGMLLRWGMRPTAVEGGRAALQALQVAKSTGHPFPLVLLDGQMPEMDGFTLAHIIQRDPSLVGATIMMLTSAGHMGDAARCRELGIAAYLVKPIRQAELFQGICALLNAGQEQPSTQLVTKHSLRETRNRFRVLLAEDNAVNQKLACRLLEKRGFLVTVAGDGQIALDILNKESFDLILMDVQMPNLNGFETTAAIRAKEKSTDTHIPIIAMTAHALKGDEEACILAGMDGYVSKPIRTNELFSLIEQLLGKANDILTADLELRPEKLTNLS